MGEYDDTAVAGTAACIQEPEDEHDLILQRIYQWYLLYYQRGLNPPIPHALISRFRQLADEDEDWQQTVEICIYLAELVTTQPEQVPYAFQAIRVTLLALRFLSRT